MLLFVTTLALLPISTKYFKHIPFDILTRAQRKQSLIVARKIVKLVQGGVTGRETVITHRRDAKQERWGTPRESTQGQPLYERHSGQEFRLLDSVPFLQKAVQVSTHRFFYVWNYFQILVKSL